MARNFTMCIQTLVIFNFLQNQSLEQSKKHPVLFLLWFVSALDFRQKTAIRHIADYCLAKALGIASPTRSTQKVGEVIVLVIRQHVQ